MAALGATLDNADYLFKYAYGFVVLAYISTVGAWLTSKAVEKEHRLRTRQRRRSGEPSPFPFKTWGGCLFCTVLAVVLINFVSDVRVHKELQSLSNRLYPGSERIPGNGCSGEEFQGRTLFLFGNDGNASLVKKFPHTIVSIKSDKLIESCSDECPVLSVGKDEDDGYMYVIMDVRDKDNKVIVQLDAKGFHINPNNYYRMNRSDRSSLTVTDQEGNTVLDVHYLNPQAVSIGGILYLHGRKFPLYTRGISNSCAIEGGQSDFLFEVP